MKFDDVLEIATASTRRLGNERLGIEDKVLSAGVKPIWRFKSKGYKT